MNRIVVVHQMGKVGSSSLFAALRQTEGIDAYQTHNLIGRKSLKAQHDLHAHKVQHELLPSGRSLRFISGVRDPMARNISAFFQNHAEGLESAQQAIDRFLDHVPNELEVTRHWFDQQFGATLGIDVFRREADFSNGGHVVAGNVLILRIEDPVAARESAIARFLDLDAIRLPSVNVGSEKPYAKIYREFKERFRPPRQLVEDTFDCRFVKHFYPKAHEAMKQKWLDRSG